MRIVAAGLFIALAIGGSPAIAQNSEFMKECVVTAAQNTCQCIAARIPANMMGNAILGLRKSNQSVSVSGNLLDPATLNQNEMLGLNAVVAAQAYCM
jgi:hypothetical protein